MAQLTSAPRPLDRPSCREACRARLPRRLLRGLGGAAGGLGGLGLDLRGASGWRTRASRRWRWPRRGTWRRARCCYRPWLAAAGGGGARRSRAARPAGRVAQWVGWRWWGRCCSPSATAASHMPSRPSRPGWPRCWSPASRCGWCWPTGSSTASGCRPAGWLALVVGLAGIAILARPHGHGAVLPVLVVLGGSVSWGIGSVLAGRLPTPASPLLGSAMEMLTGGPCLPGSRRRPAS